MSDPVRIFISYSRKDLAYLEALETHLANLKRQNRIAVWTDQRLRPSTEWEPDLLDQLRRAEIVLLLVTPDLMASDFIHDVELKETLERDRRKEVKVVPVLVRPTDLKGHELARFQGLPRNFKPVSEWPGRDQAWVEVVEGVRTLIEGLRKRTAADRPQMTPIATDVRAGGDKRRPGPAPASTLAPAQETGTQSLTLLHLSDLHFGQDQKEATSRFNQALVTRLLLEDIATQVQKGLKPDYILVTGDIAFSAQPAEYQQAALWLQKVCETCGLEPHRLLLVPGNHDVDRKKALAGAGNWVHLGLRAQPLQLNDLLKHEHLPQLQSTLWPKLTAYETFAQSLSGLSLTPEKPFWSQPIEMALSRPVVALGLNSCLLSYDGDDAPTNLALGLAQLEAAFSALPKDALVLALLHHPPEWLVDGGPHQHAQVQVAHTLLSYLQKLPHLLFCGHVHQQGGLVSHPLHTGGLVRFVAGAGHESVSEGGHHAYAWVRVHGAGLDFYPRTWNADHQRFQPEANRFELVKGQDYTRLRRSKLSDLLEEWLPPDPDQPRGIARARLQLSERYQSELDRLKRLEQAGAPPESVRTLKRELLTLKQQLRYGNALRAGDVLDERYLMLEHLRTGGFASVWKAKRLDDGLLVAIKVLRQELVASDEVRARFRRGNEQLQRLTHPFICPILEPLQEEPPWQPDGPLTSSGEASFYPHYHYCVLSLAPGGDLETYVLRHKPGWQELVTRLLRVADALIFAHGKDCIHRDVKPHNVLLRADGLEWLTDFDLAKVRDSTQATRTGTLGTAYYAAPELHEHDAPSDARTDVYGLGMTLFFGLVQQPLSAKHMLRRELVIEALAVPTPLKEALRHAVELEPDERFPTMEAFQAALKEVLAQESRPRSQPASNPVVAPKVAEALQATPAPQSTSAKTVPAKTPPVKTTPAQSAPVKPPPDNAMLAKKSDLGAVSKVVLPLQSLEVELARLPLQERLQRLKELGRTGDPRLGLEKPVNWIWIPPGEFMMGDDKGDSDEKPAHKVTFAHGFHMSRFPVTNHDFKAFVEGGGYREKNWWSEEGWHWRMLKGEAFEGYFQRLRKWFNYVEDTEDGRATVRPGDQPRFFEHSLLNAPNQPVVGVSLYESEAFCRWMNAQRRQLPSTFRNGEKPGVIRLPTEAEWEYAARGKDGRKYPWGNEDLSPERANYDETGLKLISPVGAFPLGATPEGLLDMAGNAWEWVLDHYASDYKGAPTDGSPRTIRSKYSRVLRGGSWDYNGGGLRAAYRLFWVADDRDNDVGFRVVRGSPVNDP